MITANRGISRPFIPRKYCESPGFIPRGRYFVQVLPKSRIDLKIISLMRGHIKKSLVAGKIKIAFNGVHANGFASLAMQIAPKTGMIRCLDDQRAGLGKFDPIDHNPDAQSAFLRHREVFQGQRAVVGRVRQTVGQSLNGH